MPCRNWIDATPEHSKEAVLAFECVVNPRHAVRDHSRDLDASPCGKAAEVAGLLDVIGIASPAHEARRLLRSVRHQVGIRTAGRPSVTADAADAPNMPPTACVARPSSNVRLASMAMTMRQQMS